MTRPVPHPPSPPADVDDALQRIRDNGGRVTPGKRALATLLYASDGALTADEIIDRLDDPDRSAVYRRLAQFEELGIAEHFHLGHGQAAYRHAGLPTVPVLCSSCGRTHDLDRADTEVFVSEVARRTGVALDLKHFPLTGVCRDCDA